MTRVLLDTHTLLWWWTNDDRLSRSAYDAVADTDNEVFASAASAWEIATKEQIGKLADIAGAASRYADLVESHGFVHLDIGHRHALRAGGYQVSHRDPFDRLLAAQAELERLALVTIDAAFASFGIDTVW